MAAFSGTPPPAYAPLAVQFTDASTDAPTSWSWTFGDGGTSYRAESVHTYTTAGTYTVSLTATNAVRFGRRDQDGYITVSEPDGRHWTTITYDDFEGGFGSYTDGGGDCARYTGGTYAHQGSARADIQDNSGMASSFYHTASYNVTGYTELEVDFWFYAVQHGQLERGLLGPVLRRHHLADGGDVRPRDRLRQQHLLLAPCRFRGQYNFPTNAKLRFMCDASGNRTTCTSTRSSSAA